MEIVFSQKFHAKLNKWKYSAYLIFNNYIHTAEYRKHNVLNSVSARKIKSPEKEKRHKI